MKPKRLFLAAAAAGLAAYCLAAALAPKDAQAGIFPLVQGCNNDGVCKNYLGVSNGMAVLFIENHASCPSDCK